MNGPYSHSHRPHKRPPWWPENETWPPSKPPWMRGGRVFFWRIGCLFFVFILLIAFLTMLIAGTAAFLLGILHFPAQMQGISREGLTLFLFGAGLLFLVGLGLRGGIRRLSIPFGQLLEAAERVEAGDYSARVSENGPPELRSLARGFNAMAKRLQTSDEQRRNLMADVTHELRTPLTVIQGNLEGMIDGIYPADEDRLRSLLEETQVLARLVEDLRTLALAESGALQLVREPVDLTDLLIETAGAFQPQAEAAGVRLEVNRTEQELPVLSLDPGRFRQVISNLLANSLRYTPRGGTIRLGFSLEADGRHVYVMVADDGRGISQEELAHVFERFYKSRDSGGMGLGLAIAKYLVEAHGGLIQVDSQVEKGTTFQVLLPVNPSPGDPI